MVRHQPTRLERKRLGTAYRRRLTVGLQLVYEFLFSRDPNLLEDLREDRVNFLTLDQLLAEFVNQCHDAGTAFWLVKHRVLGLQTEFRYVRFKLPRTWDSISSWNSERLRRSRTPIDENCILFMSFVALSWAFEEPKLAHLLFPFSVLIRLAFYGLLRPGEMLQLRTKDTHVANEEDRPQLAILAIQTPKTRRFAGRQQFVVIKDVYVIAWLRWLTHGLPPSLILWPSSSNMFRTIFIKIIERCGLQGHKFSPAGFRAGGCIHFVVRGWDLSRVQFLGRWKSHCSMVSYVQEAVASLVWVQLDVRTRLVIRQTLATASSIAKLPPSLPWAVFFSRRAHWRSVRT